MILGAYLIGSVSTAILVCKALRLPDPRTSGSNNPGATNVLRIGGRSAAAMTLAGDMLKGLAPVLSVRALDASPGIVAAVALAAFAGHLFPIFFQFRGGKGVATALGALFGASPISGLLAIATWLAISLLSRVSSVAALATFTLVPVFLYIQGQPRLAAGFCTIGVLLFFTHRKNLQRLRAGTEPKIGAKSMKKNDVPPTV